MRLLHTADVHLELASYGRPVEEFGATFRLFAETAIAEKVDVAVIAGDLFHSRKPGPLAIALAVRPIRMLVDAGIPVVIGPGNHDGMGTIASPDTHTLAWMAELALPGVHVATRPEVTWFEFGMFAVLPYAHKRAVEQTTTLAERTAEASRILEQTIADMGTNGAKDKPFVFVGHLTTLGASLGAEGAMQMGWDTTVDPAVFDPFDYAALGHIHVGQQASAKAWYAGSPDVHAFGELAEDKRFLLVDVQKGEAPVVRPIPTHTRQVVRVVVGGDSDVRTHITPDLAGAIVELVFETEVPPGLAEAWVRFAKDVGVVFVRTKVPPPVRDLRLDMADVDVESLTVEEQMRKWLARDGATVDEEVVRLGLEVVKSFGAE